MWPFALLFAAAGAFPRAMPLPPPVEVGLHLDPSAPVPTVAVRVAAHGPARLSYRVQYRYSTDGRKYVLLNHNADHTGPVPYTPACRTLSANATASLSYPYSRFFARFDSEAAFFAYAGADVVYVQAVVKDCATNQAYYSPPLRVTKRSGH
jgi:hypothetical protein